MVVARFEQWPPPELSDGSCYGVLLFGDGSQKMLAAMTCWIALLMVWRGHAEDSLNIVQQNIAAKVQPISSLSWASILVSFHGANVEEALAAYNGHPDVIAHDRNDSGAGSIALDGRKKQAVRNWMERTCQKAFDEVVRSTHDLPFNLGPFGEAFALCTSCFLGSKANLDALPTADGVAYR